MKDFIVIMVGILLGGLHIISAALVIKTRCDDYGLMYVGLFILNILYGLLIYNLYNT